MNILYYDIESLQNTFTLCSYSEDDDRLDIFFKTSNENIFNTLTKKELYFLVKNKVLDSNPNFKGQVVLYDLDTKEANLTLAKTFGVSNAANANNPYSKSDFPSDLRLVCDTDKEYDPEKHPYLMGYNSANYDTTILTYYLYRTFQHLFGYKYSIAANKKDWDKINPPSPEEVRRFNDKLFRKEFKKNMPSALAHDIYDVVETEKNSLDDGFPYHDTTDHGPNYGLDPWKIRKNMLRSGRHIDIAKLNEAQRMVALKRLLGMLGFQILESDKLKTGNNVINTLDEFLDLLAYNASDVINLKELFYHTKYKSAFDNKKLLLDTYPELIYVKKKTEYAPDICPEGVDRNRLTIDDTSAKFAARSLCPYGELEDMPVVSFMYPSKEKAKELGIKRRDILEEANDFFYENFKDETLREEWQRVYKYYDNIRGKNFNDTLTSNVEPVATVAFGNKPIPAKKTDPVYKLAEMPKMNTFLHYYTKEGKETSCYVNFSTGGIHGGEYNRELYLHHLKEFENLKTLLEKIQSKFSTALEFKQHVSETARKNKELKSSHYYDPDTGELHKISNFIKSGHTLKKAEWKDLDSKKPILFKKNPSGSWGLNKKYTFTSSDKANHEDFDSYYPNMLIMLRAFLNDKLGYDRYAEIYTDKQKFGTLMKEKGVDPLDALYYNGRRNGTKLILNAASGAADTEYDVSIKMNNTIISMRIIGQLLSWRIGQAQTLKGAKITSTNTDGLYSVLEEELNNKILAEESTAIGIKIDPEPLYLISKDSNNRLEFDDETGVIYSGSGADLACHNGPNPEKSLAHPAILDWALARYLIKHRADLSKPFNKKDGLEILNAAKESFDDDKCLVMFQNIISSNDNSYSYNFGVKASEENWEESLNVTILQHYNRVFYVKPSSFKSGMHLRRAVARAVTPATKLKREKTGEIPFVSAPLPRKVLKSNGHLSIIKDKDEVVAKITRLDPNWESIVENKSIYDLEENYKKELVNNLDLNAYLELLEDTYESNWRNTIPTKGKSNG